MAAALCFAWAGGLRALCFAPARVLATALVCFTLACTPRQAAPSTANTGAETPAPPAAGIACEAPNFRYEAPSFCTNYQPPPGECAINYWREAVIDPALGWDAQAGLGSCVSQVRGDHPERSAASVEAWCKGAVGYEAMVATFWGNENMQQWPAAWTAYRAVYAEGKSLPFAVRALATADSKVILFTTSPTTGRGLRIVRKLSNREWQTIEAAAKKLLTVPFGAPDLWSMDYTCLDPSPVTARIETWREGLLRTTRPPQGSNACKRDSQEAIAFARLLARLAGCSAE